MKTLLLLVVTSCVYLTGCSEKPKKQSFEEQNTQEQKQANLQDLKQQQRQLDLLKRSYEIDLDATSSL